MNERSAQYYINLYGSATKALKVVESALRGKLTDAQRKSLESVVNDLRRKVGK